MGLAQIPKPEAIRDYCQKLTQRYFPSDPDAAKRMHLPIEQEEICETAIQSWADMIIPRVAEGKALTLLHGDADCSNVFFPRNPETHGPLIFDWESCTRGLGVYDICRFILESAPPPERRQALEKNLLRRYYDGLSAEGIRNYSWEDCLYDYRLSIIAHLQTWLEVTYEWFDGRPTRHGKEGLEANINAFKDWDCAELLD